MTQCIACEQAGRPYDPDRHDSQNCWAGYPLSPVETP